MREQARWFNMHKSTSSPKKYDIQALKSVAETRYAQTLKTQWDTDDFATSLAMIYEHIVVTDRSLKDVALERAGQHLHKLLKKEGFAKLCQSNNKICFDVLKASSAESVLAEQVVNGSSEAPPRCPECTLGGTFIKASNAVGNNGAATGVVQTSMVSLQRSYGNFQASAMKKQDVRHRRLAHRTLTGTLVMLKEGVIAVLTPFQNETLRDGSTQA